MSVGVRELACRLAADGRSFARTAANLQHSAQVTISEELLRQVVEQEGKAVLTCQRAEELEVGWTASQCLTTRPDGTSVSRVYVSGDGVLVPLTTQAEKLKRRQTVRTKRKGKRGLRPLPAVKKGADQRYKQVYVSAIYDQQQAHRLVSVTRGHHVKLRRQLKRDAARVRLRAADERVGLVDGAVCLRQDLEQLPLTSLGLDFYHLGQHVAEGRRATFATAAEGERWSDQLLHTVKHEGYEPFWQQLTQWRKDQRGGKRKAADSLLHYVAERHSMIDYPRSLAHGWHIGTGPIESMCGVTTARVKGAGKRWDGDNAEAMMGLEALHQSNQWGQYWTSALQAVT